MKYLFSTLLCTGACLACTAVAQTPQAAVLPTADSIPPTTTVVPVQQPAVQVVERTTVYEEPARNLSRTQRRARRAEIFAQRIDSLVQSRNWMFFPNSMQEVPGGTIRQIYAGYFFFGMFVDHVEVHLPTERGISQYVEMLNFDSMSLGDYRSSRLQWGWCISLDIADGDHRYHAEFEISTVTGETVLTLIAPQLTMRYVGWLWNKRPDDPRYRRLIDPAS